MTVKLFDLLTLARDVFPEAEISIETASGERCGWTPKDGTKSVVTIREERKAA